MGGDNRRHTPIGGYPAITLEMIRGVKEDITAVDNRLTASIGAVSVQVGDLKDETAVQSAALARIETTLLERQRKQRAVTEVRVFKLRRTKAIIALIGAAISGLTALVTHYLGG